MSSRRCAAPRQATRKGRAPSAYAPEDGRRDRRGGAVRLGLFLDFAKAGGYDLLCHHAARVGDYRSPDFDIPGALAENTANLRAVLEIMGRGGLKASC